MAKILMVASEATPFIKTGGLADVAGSLPAALKERGEDVAVVLPRYREARIDGARRVAENIAVWLGQAKYSVDVQLAVERGVPYYFIDCPALYDREGIYVNGDGDFPDNHIRFAVLAKAAFGIIRYVYRPDILHCHDWQASLAPVYLKTALAGDPTFMGIRTVLTIHNLGYQGIFPPAMLPQIGLDTGVFTIGGLEFFGNLNLLKGGIVYSDAITTVSKGYACEIQTEEYGFGLDGLLRDRSSALTGILNGVDYSLWNPETDNYIAAHYSVDDLSGKSACKLDLLRKFGLPDEAAERPLIGIVSRFAGQKGFDLIEEIASDLASEDVTIVALGTGEMRYEDLFRRLAASHPGKIAVRIAYDNPLAHKIEAGADMFLMPSLYEPCGLNQIYSLRYGTVPVVRATGGLDDTIDEGTGFKFKEYSGAALLATLRDALAAWQNRERWKELMRNGMRKDFSWNASAGEYAALYHRLLG
ncbi:MAG: glycogen synthase GlgA [Bryobacteraceae bacterium]